MKQHWTLLILGLAVGVIHFWVSFWAIFVMRGDEAVWGAVIIGAGPLSTFPAVVIGFFFPKVGAVWLLTGPILSMIALGMCIRSDLVLQVMMEGLLRYYVPMFSLGIGHIYVCISQGTFHPPKIFSMAWRRKKNLKDG